MVEPVREPVPWLGHFERDPATAIDELLRGIAEVAPYERAEPVDVLLALFGGLPEDDPRRVALDRALSSWLVSRRADDQRARHNYGLHRYVDELIQALVVVHRLPLPETVAILRRELASFETWLRDLYLGPARDPAGELWRVMAQTQHDRSLLEDWYRLCGEAGRSLPDHWIDVGLSGLRRLPQPGSSEPTGTLDAEVLDGLFRWAAHLPSDSVAREAFQRRLGTLMVLYPRTPRRWRELVLPLLKQYPDAPFHDWLKVEGLDLLPAHPPDVEPSGISSSRANERRASSSDCPAQAGTDQGGAPDDRVPAAIAEPHALENRVTDSVLAAAIESLERLQRVQESFQIVYRRYYRPLVAYFQSRVSLPEEALDLTQETLFVAFSRLRRLQRDDPGRLAHGALRGRSSLDIWLYWIASIRLLAYYRTRPTERHSNSGPEAVNKEPRDDDTLVEILNAERRRLLSAAIDDLPEQFRQCMFLRLDHQQSNQEIATRLGLSIEAVTARLLGGFRALCQRIGQPFRAPVGGDRLPL